ncbi:hypothetical protein BGZ76_004391 [Entomortierella beljakovae]|nr:hypothetical protein BGZ76_004391 [Entomortierella beljakovae]
MSMTTEEIKSEGAVKGPVGGPLTKKQRKEQFDNLSTLQTQLDVSVSLARNQVSSWLNADAFSDDEEDNNSSGFTAATVIKPRQPGLGLGAKFISHKDQMRHVPMNAFESKLKRQLTGGIVASEIRRAEDAEKNALPDKYMEHKLMMAARRKELQEQAEDEEDSKTRNIGGNNSISAKKSIAVSSATSHSTSSSQKSGNHNPDSKYKAAVHPAAQNHSPEANKKVTESSPTSKQSIGSAKKRSGDFFSMYMDERASKMAKKKKKNQAKIDPDDD